MGHLLLTYEHTVIFPAFFAGLAPPEADACLKDSDCPAGKECRTSQPVEVCKCLEGMDACNKLGTCLAIPAAPAQPAPVLTPCQQCQNCIRIMQAVIADTQHLDDPFAVAGKVDNTCTRNFTALACSQLKAAVSYSSKGNLGKRAASVCKQLGECGQQLLPGGAEAAACTLAVASLQNLSVNVSGPLDLCAMEGVGGGKQVVGTTTDASKYQQLSMYWQLDSLLHAADMNEGAARGTFVGLARFNQRFA